MAEIDIRSTLLRAYHSANGYADESGWWRDPEILRRLAPALSELHPDIRPTAVLGTESRGLFLAGLVAVYLNVGVVEVKKGEPSDDMVPDRFWVRHAPPDYRDRDLVLSVPRTRLTDRDRILFVDDWIETGAQAMTASNLVQDVGAEWIGGAVIVDNSDWAIRRKLNIRSLLHIRDLPD